MTIKLPLSLSHYFCPPEGFLGEFGVVVGYSADCDFMNDALEKFTSNTQKQRAYLGDISLVLMLDPKHQQLPIVDCPGLLHLPFKTEHKTNFNLLHAKVALLLFKNKQADHYIARLIVSTGNWTRQTIEESLDLAWSVELDLNAQSVQECADVKAAYNFLSRLLTNFDQQILQHSYSKSRNIFALFHEKLDTLNVPKSAIPRFFENSAKSLITQIPDLVKQHTKASKRNYLLLGSGFYQSEVKSNEEPSVIQSIRQALEDNELLTSSAQKYLVVNPESCQAISESVAGLIENNWEVYEAYDPIRNLNPTKRSLHAKFIFSAINRDSSEKCLSSWMYLGSGNLTKQGLTQKASSNGGNLEAGVVFECNDLTWEQVCGKLPFSIDDNLLIPDNTKLSVGGEFVEHDSAYIAPPIAYFVVKTIQDDEIVLVPSSPVTSEISLPSNLMLINQDELIWSGKLPRQIVVGWSMSGIEYQANVPVIDEFGRAASGELPQIELADAWNLFNAFPQLPEQDEDDTDDGISQGNAQGKPEQVNVESDYILNRMMGLIELIAEKQTHVKQRDWEQWCTRLEQTLMQLKSANAFSFFKAINVNPLSPLWHAPFRPIYAENSETHEGNVYELLLNRIEQKLGLTTLMKLGVQDEI